MNASRVGATIAAVLLPATLLTTVFSYLSRPDVGFLDERAQRIREKLQASPPDVVIVGNSLARDDIDSRQLARALDRAGAGTPAVSKLAVGGTPPAVWYAMLKHRVFGEGFEPDVIIVAGTLTSWFWSEVTTVDGAQRLREAIGTNDAEILRKATNRRLVIPALERANTRKVQTRNQVVEGWAEVVVDLVLHRHLDDRQGEVEDLDFDNLAADVAPDHQGGLARARARIDAAFAATFESDDAVDMSLHQRVIPVLQDQDEHDTADLATPIERTFLPEFLALAREHEARLVFVRVPLSPSRQEHDPDDRLGDLVTWANANGVGFVDLSDLEVEERLFRDGEHLNRGGREVFTDAMAQALITLGVFGEGALEPATMPLPAVSIQRDAPPPAITPIQSDQLQAAEGCLRVAQRPDLAPLGTARLDAKALWKLGPLRRRVDGELVELDRVKTVEERCQGVAIDGERVVVAGLEPPIELALAEDTHLVAPSGAEAWWLYPGSGLELRPGAERVADWGTEELQIEVVAQPLERKAAEVVLTMDGQAHPLDQRSGRLVRTVLTRQGLPELLSFSSQAPAVLRMVRVRRGDRGELLLGDPQRAGEAILRIFDGGSSAATFDGPPPPLDPDSSATVQEGQLVWKIPELKHINTSQIARRADKFNCSPLRVAHGEDLLTPRWRPCAKVQEPGDTCHDGNLLRLVPPAGLPLDPSAYQLRLDPSRACRTWTYLYGGDTMAVQIANSALRPLLAELSQLELMATVMERPDEKGRKERWTVTLQAGDRRLVQRRVRPSDLDAGVFRARLKRAPRLRDLVLSVQADPDAPPLLIGYALLREAAITAAPTSRGGTP